MEKLLLNQGQQKAAAQFMDFLFDKENNEIALIGEAGVGKTYLLTYLAETVIPSYKAVCNSLGIDPVYKEAIFTASTNKAAEVLASATQQLTNTIHSQIGIRLLDNYATGETTLVKSGSWKIHSNAILFIDEAPMLGNKVLKFIDEATLNCKIVYIGDVDQLPPVKEPVPKTMGGKTNSIPPMILTEQMRAVTCPDVFALSRQLKETVRTGVFKDIHTSENVLWFNGEDAEKVVIDNFAAYSSNNKILVYTNNRAVQYNEYIRKLRNLPDHFVPGESLVAAKTIKSKDQILANTEDSVKVIDYLGLLKASDPLDKVAVDSYAYIVSVYGKRARVLVPVDKHELVRAIKRANQQKDYRTYFNLQNSYADLRMPDAATVHKSQGSSYQNVFIDLSDIYTCKQPSLTARLMYVAVSRSKSKVYLFNGKNSKYGKVTTD